MSQTQRRIVSNYVRLGCTFAMGFASIALMGALGSDALILYLTLFSLRWIVLSFAISLEVALVPAFGANPTKALVASGWVAAGLAGLLVCLLVGVAVVYRSVFDFGALPDGVVLLGFGSTAATVLTQTIVVPIQARLILSGHMVLLNSIITLRRATEFIPILLVATVLAGPLQDRLSALFVMMIAGSLISITGIAFCAARFGFLPRRTALNWANLCRIGTLTGWSLMQIGGQTLFLRGSVLVVNIVLGAMATSPFGVICALLAYQRQASTGLVAGLDGVIATARGPLWGRAENGMRIQTGFALAWLGIIWWAIGPALDLMMPNTAVWDHDETVQLFRIMVIGMTLRTVADYWIKTLSGAGQIYRVGPSIMGFAILYIGVIALLGVVLPTGSAMLFIALSFLALHLFLYGWLIPKRLLGSETQGPSALWLWLGAAVGGVVALG